jgi:hypothetical protein
MSTFETSSLSKVDATYGVRGRKRSSKIGGLPQMRLVDDTVSPPNDKAEIF